MADALGLGPSGEIRGGSNPFSGTNFFKINCIKISKKYYLKWLTSWYNGNEGCVYLIHNYKWVSHHFVACRVRNVVSIVQFWR